jgi:hypothetical protein
MGSRNVFQRSRRTASIIVAAFVLSAPGSAQEDCSQPAGATVSPGDTINISATSAASPYVSPAIDYWSGCSGYGTQFPQFQAGGTGGVPVTVVLRSGNSTCPTGGGCGCIERELVNGHLESAVITLWTHGSNGVSCTPHQDTLAHELGHVLGLTDNFHEDCDGHIMGGRVSGGRTVRDDDCEVARDRWETTYETSPPDDPWCNAYCWTECVNGSCPQGHPGCPILFDLENDGFHLTGLGDPVWFDIDADGAVDLLSWTDRGEGFLALDRNANGRIDDGSELFGNATRLADGSRAPNGYEALAELDGPSFGGNGDGFVDAADASYWALWLWSDLNHDGISQPEELISLHETAIRRMEVDYRRSHRRDRHGNEFRFLGRAWKQSPQGVLRPVLTWDVFFVVGQGAPQ